MSADEVIIMLIMTAAFCLMIAAANYADHTNRRGLKQTVAGLIVLINARMLITYGVRPMLTAYGTLSAANGATAPTKNEAGWALVLTLIITGFTMSLLLRVVRERMAVLFPPHQLQTAAQPAITAPIETEISGAGLEPKPAETPLFPQMLNYYTTASTAPLTATHASESVSLPIQRDTSRSDTYQVRGFNPDSAVHTLALVLMIYLVGLQVINFVLGGGLAGVAEGLEEGGITPLDLLVQLVLLVSVSVVGVGLAVRRSGRQIVQRLGLGVPTLEGIAAAGGMTIGLLIFVAIVASAWQGLVSEETFEQQTEASDALSGGVTTLWLAFMVAATAAIGEEIAFRGALQPVFGLWPTSIIFALTHIQYTLTPAALIILGVALGFGWLRQGYNTTVAIMTHFMYNFIPLALVVLVPEEEAILRLLGLM